MTSKRDLLKIAIFEGSHADLEATLNACCKSLGIAKTMGTLIGIWTAHYISPDDDALLWGHNAWNKYACFGKNGQRMQNIQQLVKMAQTLSALPIQSSVPSYNVCEHFTNTLNASLDKFINTSTDEIIVKKIRKYATRQARPYLFEWIKSMRQLKTGLDVDAQDSIWRLLNTMLATLDLSTLKHTLPSMQPNSCQQAYSNHILALLWDLLVTEHQCLRGVANLFMCELVSPNMQLTERLPLLYITCLYLPVITALFDQFPMEPEKLGKDLSGKKGSKAKNAKDSVEEINKACSYLWEWGACPPQPPSGEIL